MGLSNRDRFFEAFAHEGHEVMGYALARFTLRHRFWLEAFESPVVQGGEVRLVDLELAAMICAIPYGRLDERVPRLVGGRGRRLRRLRFVGKTLTRRPRAEYGKLLAYLLDHGSPPEVHGGCVEEGDPDGPPPPPGKRGPDPDRFGTVPGLLSLVTGLMKRTNWDPNVVWGLGPGEAEWYLTGVLLHDGVDVPIKTPQDEEFEEGLRREREAAAAVTPAGECEGAVREPEPDQP